MIRAGAFLTESTVAFGFPRLSCGRPAVVEEWNEDLDGASRLCRLIARTRVNRIPDRDGSIVAIRRPPTIEHRQSPHGVDREPGGHLRVFVSIDVLLLDDDIAHECLKHLGRHADVALQEFAQMRERGDEVLFVDALHVRPPAGSLELLEPLPLGRQLPAHLLRLGEHRPTMMLLANCGALVTALLGCLGLLFPAAVWHDVVGILFEASVGGAMLAARFWPSDAGESRRSRAV